MPDQIKAEKGHTCTDNICPTCDPQVSPRRAEKDTPHEFDGSGGVCHRCGRWDTNGIHDTAEASVDLDVAYVRPAGEVIASVADSEAVARARALAAEWLGWAETRSTVRIDAFRDAAERLLEALDGPTTSPAGGEQ